MIKVGPARARRDGRALRRRPRSPRHRWCPGPRPLPESAPGSPAGSVPPGSRRRSACAARPVRLNSAISRMVSTDSCLAGSMKLQVLTTMASASSGLGCQLVAARHQQAHHDLGIDEVLGTTQADESDFQGLFPGGERAYISGYHAGKSRSCWARGIECRLPPHRFVRSAGSLGFRGVVARIVIVWITRKSSTVARSRRRPERR